MRVSPLFLVAIICFVKSGKAQEYYACPTLSICVLPKYCPLSNITFDVGSQDSDLHDYFEKYLCGVLAETEGYVCCSEPFGDPSHFKPDDATWYFVDDETESTGKEKLDIRIVPYPGLENAERNEEEATAINCPLKTACVLIEQCHQEYSNYKTLEALDEFSCGSTAQTQGFVCCPINDYVKGLKLNPEDGTPVYKFLQKDGSQISGSEAYLELADDQLLSNARAAPVFWNLRKLVAASEKGQHELPAADFIRDFTGRSTEHRGPWECGRTLGNNLENARIFSPVGNRTAKEGDFPWHVAILSTSYKYLCSGVIVGEKVVLTAAHCVEDVVAEKLLVRVGDIDLINDYEENTAFDVPVSLSVIHPDYDKIQLIADIAVLELQVSLRSLSYIRPACLPKNFNPAINRCKVAGWGQFTRSKEVSKELSPQLREANFVIIENGNCQNILRKAEELGAFFKLQESVLCAKGISNADTCRGDGGGGLVCKDKDIFVLKGLVSYGIGCGLNWPGVYTDVAKFLSFIENYSAFAKLKRNETSESAQQTHKPNFSNNGKPVTSSSYPKSETTGNDRYIPQQEYTSKPTYDKEIHAQRTSSDNTYFTPERPQFADPENVDFNQFTHESYSGPPHKNVVEAIHNDGIFYGEIPKHRFEPINKDDQTHNDQLQSFSNRPYEPTSNLQHPFIDEYEQPDDGLIYGPINEHHRPIHGKPAQQQHRPSYEEIVAAHTQTTYEEPINRHEEVFYNDPVYQDNHLAYDEPVRPPYNFEKNRIPYDRIIYEESIGPNDPPNYDQTIKRPVYIPESSINGKYVGNYRPNFEESNQFYDREPRIEFAHHDSVRNDHNENEELLGYNDRRFHDELVSNNGPNYGVPVGNNGPNYGVPVGNNGPNYGVPVGNNGPNYGVPVGNNGPNYGVPVGNNGPNYEVPVGNNGPNYEVPVGNNGPNYEVPVGNNGPNYEVPVSSNERIYYKGSFNEVNDRNPSKYGFSDEQTFRRPSFTETYDRRRSEFGRSKNYETNERKYLNVNEPLSQVEENYNNPSKIYFNDFQNNPGNYENSFQEAFHKETPEERNAPLSFLKRL